MASREMEEDAMIFTEKMCRKLNKSQMNNFSSTKTLNDFNFKSSSDYQKKGCFRFLRHNSSSSNNKDPFLKSKSHPQTPKSAPTSSKTHLSSKPITNPSSFRIKNRSKTLSENPQNLILKKPAKPNRKPERIFKVDFKLKNGSFRSEVKEGKLPHVLDFKAKNGSFGSEVKEGKARLSATPPSNCTPPIQASISPEVRCGFSVTPTPVCFATGHVMAGVEDRRKCRPRGILTIGEEQGNLSRVSSAPPLVEASVCWFSSPLETRNGSGRDAHCSKVRTFDVIDEASVNCLLSPSDEMPLSCNCILRTPSSGCSVSPFSVIVQRAEESSRLQVLNFRKDKGMYRYGNALDVSPFSEKSGSNSGGVSATSSYTNSRLNGVISPLEIDSAAEDLGAMRLLTKPVLGNNQNDVSPLHSLSFKFGCQPIETPLNSIDLNCFKSPRCDEVSKVELRKKNLSVSGARISWREGLLSRMFEMGELDSYHSLFDDDEDLDHARDGNVKSESGFKIALEKGSSTFEKGNGFGSYEFPFDSEKIGVQKCQSKTPLLESNSFAESISTDGGLISSGDSDWTLFYKNNLFEV